MDTMFVQIKQAATLLNDLNTISENIIREAQTASRKMLDVATPVGEGQGHIIDFSTSAVRAYQDALVKRDMLLTVLRMMRDQYSDEALEAAAQGRGVWFLVEGE